MSQKKSQYSANRTNSRVSFEPSLQTEEKESHKQSSMKKSKSFEKQKVQIVSEQQVPAEVMLTQLSVETPREQRTYNSFSQDEEMEEYLQRVQCKEGLEEETIKMVNEKVKDIEQALVESISAGSILIADSNDQMAMAESLLKNNSQFIRNQHQIQLMNQKKRSMQVSLDQIDRQISDLDHQKNQFITHHQNKNAKHISKEEQTRLRLKVAKLEKSRKQLEARREQHYQDFLKDQELQHQLQLDNESKLIQQQKEKKKQQAQIKLKEIEERAKQREQYLSKFKKKELKQNKSLLDIHKEKLQKVRDMKGQRVDITEIQEHEQQVDEIMKLKKQHREEKKNKRNEEMGKMKVFESQVYKKQHQQYLEDLQEDKEKKKREENLKELLKDIKKKHQPKVDEEKHQQYLQMIDQEEEEKKKKWKGQQWDREKKEWVKQYKIPKFIENKEYQHYQYTEGNKYLGIAKQLKREKDRESEEQLSEVVKSEPPALPIYERKNYLQDQEVKKRLVHDVSQNKRREYAEQKQDAERLKEQAKQIDQLARRQEKVDLSVETAQFHGKHNGKSSISYQKTGKINTAAQQLYLDSIKTKLALFQQQAN